MANSQKQIRKDLDKFERKYLKKKKLPNELRDYLLKNGGTRPNPSAFKIYGLDYAPEDQDAIHTVLGSSDPLDSLCATYEILKDRIPENFVPFAMGEFGDFICYSMDESDFGHIWYWNHEEECEPGEVDRSNCYSCADSLAEFLENLSEDPEEDYNHVDDDEIDRVYLENSLVWRIPIAAQGKLSALGFAAPFPNPHYKRRELPTMFQWSIADDLMRKPTILTGYTLKLDLTLWKDSAPMKTYKELQKVLETLYSRSYVLCWKKKIWSMDYVEQIINREVGKGWRDRGNEDEIDRGYAPFLKEVEEYVDREVLPIFTKYDSDAKVYDEYKKKRISLYEISSMYISPYLYLASYAYKQGDLVETYARLQLWYLLEYERSDKEEKAHPTMKMWKKLVDSAAKHVEKEYEKTPHSKSLDDAMNDFVDEENDEFLKDGLFERLEEEGAKHERLFGI